LTTCAVNQLKLSELNQVALDQFSPAVGEEPIG